ncbi:hypothetical protein Aglo03_61840 [Actinokineospora globicatena]|uniref:Uncharacterized protein n=1 Tax=Actinokineospora globicatena TaxID=103729 RepID=A0A9W6QUN5_9PSEU|nr:hypothetical protein Aglo03_61840 [Actinokineospora globicatena]
MGVSAERELPSFFGWLVRNERGRRDLWFVGAAVVVLAVGGLAGERSLWFFLSLPAVAVVHTLMTYRWWRKDELANRE